MSTLAYFQAHRRSLKAQGLCTRCGQRPLVQGLSIISPFWVSRPSGREGKKGCSAAATGLFKVFHPLFSLCVLLSRTLPGYTSSAYLPRQRRATAMPPGQAIGARKRYACPGSYSEGQPSQPPRRDWAVSPGTGRRTAYPERVHPASRASRVSPAGLQQKAGVNVPRLLMALRASAYAF